MPAANYNAAVLANGAAGENVMLLTARWDETTPAPACGQFYMLRAWKAEEAPLLQLAAELAAQGVDVDLYAGFRDEPYRVDAFSAACRSVHIATDSGRHGHHGFVTDLLDPAKYTAVCTCGPEIMMEKVAKMCLRAGVRVYVSREAKMACGVGACLGCTCKSKNGGVSVCKDGPVFEGSVLYELD